MFLYLSYRHEVVLVAAAVPTTVTCRSTKEQSESELCNSVSDYYDPAIGLTVNRVNDTPSAAGSNTPCSN